ncbi:MAG: TetR/AcrR family transcriptional regulator [Planctomycetales bacterium]|nr:TetR/AcrR family transcriptional regulator [Planctomycetales bacterium]
MPREANPETKERLIQAAVTLMLRQGYAGTSVDEICREAGVTKGCFFHYFAGKQAVGLEAVRAFHAARARRMLGSPSREIEDPRERILATMGDFEAMANEPGVEQGCLIGKLAQELAAIDPDMKDLCVNCFGQATELLAQDLAAAKETYAPRADWEPREVAGHCFASLQGALLVARLQTQAAPIAITARHLRDYLKHLLAT